MMHVLLLAPVLLAGIYMIGLAVGAAFWPERTRRFLAAFAGSAAAHFAELFARLIVGAALILAAPGMQFSGVFVVFGWVLVGTTVGLFAVPWRLHRRFANWSVPLATRNMPLLALGAFAGGVLLLVSLFLGPGPE